MVLILRPEDHKVLSISRKKVHCHELMYARFDPEQHERPRIEFTDFTLYAGDVDAAIQLAKVDDADKERIAEEKKVNLQHDVEETNAEKSLKVPDHVLSVKSLSDAKRNQHLSTSSLKRILDTLIDKYYKECGSGEKSELKIPEDFKFKEDLILDNIRALRGHGEGNLSESLLDAIDKIEEEIGNKAPKRGELKRGLKPKKAGVDDSNIAKSKRQRKTVRKKSLGENVTSHVESSSIKCIPWHCTAIAVQQYN
jgi:hypothetical protein